MFRVIIPARIGSTRLPAKPLQPLAGRPLIQWVFERARRSAARQVLVATDDERIAQLVRELGGEAWMTATTHASGTDRIAEVAASQGWAANDPPRPSRRDSGALWRVISRVLEPER